MTKLFYLSEVLNFAMEKEKQSYELYKDLKEHTDNKEVQNLCMLLMDQEVEHELFFKNFSETVEKRQSPGIKEDQEYVAYLNEMISSSRKVDPEAQKFHLEYEKDYTSVKIREILNYAIEREKESILFYHGLKNFVEKKDYPVIDKIIKEEGTHIEKISRLKKILSL